MRLCKDREHCYRTVLLTISISACISIAIFIFLQFTSDKEKSIKAEISNESSFHSEKLTDEKCIPVCNSRNCMKQADILLRTINPSNDPCENFQKFLCGSYDQKIGLYENGSIRFDMAAVLMNKLKYIIENIEAEPGSGAEKFKIMYDSCVNLGSSELRGIEYFRQFLDSVEIYNWPYLEADFKFTDFGLSKLLGIFRATSDVIYLAINIVSMNENEEIEMKSTEKFVRIHLIESALNDTPTVQRNAAADILNYFSIESEEIEVLLNDYDDVKNALLSFQTESVTYDISQESCPDIWIDCSNVENDEWAYVCETVKNFLNATNLNQYVSKNKIAVSECHIHFIKNLIPRLKSLPDRSVANHFALTLLWNHLDEVNFFFRRKTQKYFDYFKTERREHKPYSNRWQFCITWIINYMKIVLENELVKNYLTRSHIDEIHNFHEFFISTVSKMIDEQEWISFLPKMFLKQSIEYLDCNMHFLQRLLPNDTYINELLKMFNPTETSFFHNVLDYRISMMHSYGRRGVEMEHEKRTMEPLFTVDAQTDKETNIVLSYGIFVPPVYYPDHEKFINIIHLAPIYVHEIGHTINSLFESIPSSYNATKEMFSARKSCIENQFSKFKFLLLNENLNGTQFSDEALSDNLGYAIADKMIDELESSEDTFLLPGLSYSPKQLLYMSSRQVFCTKYTREAELLYIQTSDKHPPPESRIIASAQNSKGYSEAFSCPEGSYMNPIKKCTLFD